MTRALIIASVITAAAWAGVLYGVLGWVFRQPNGIDDFTEWERDASKARHPAGKGRAS